MSVSTLSSGHDYVYFALLLYCFFVMGLDVAVLGPSLLSLAAQTGSSLQRSSYFFTARSVGFLLGTLAGGALIDRFKNRGNSVLNGFIVLLCIVPSIIPLIESFVLLLLLLVFYGVLLGSVDNCTQILLMRHFGDRMAPFMNALHAFFGVGAWLAPLVMAFFLPDSSLIADSADAAANARALEEAANNKRWHYGFYIVSIITIPCAIGLARYSARDWRPSSSPLSDAAPPSVRVLELEFDSVSLPVEDERVADECESAAVKAYQWKIVMFVGFFLFNYVGLESGYGAYIYSYSVQYLGLAANRAAFLNSLFWGSFSLGRVFGIFISTRWSPQRMIATDLVGCLAALFVVLVASRVEAVLWIGSAAFGLSVGSIFASAINWADSRVHVSGRVLSMLVICASAGEAAVPLTMGATFATRLGPIGVIVVGALAASLASAAFAILITYVDNKPFNELIQANKKKQLYKQTHAQTASAQAVELKPSEEGQRVSVELDCDAVASPSPLIDSSTAHPINATDSEVE